jgi:hypothetical protein
MPGEGLSRIHLDGEKLLVVEDALGMPKAREMAEAQKLKAFGLLSSLLSRPKPEEIEISYEEKRYDAFWRVLGTARFEYTRRKVYRVAVEKMVQEIEVLGTAFRVPPQGGSFEIEGVERCVEDYREETIVNAQNGQPDPSFSKYLGYLSQQIASTEALTEE